jgi:hypothetical protein
MMNYCIVLRSDCRLCSCNASGDIKKLEKYWPRLLTPVALVSLGQFPLERKLAL